MDPNATLKFIREYIGDYNRGEATDFHHLIEHFEALDGWLCKGGFLPDEWKEAKKDV